MWKMIRVVVALIGIAMAGAANALTPITECNPVSVIYGNGVWTTQDGAWKSVEALSSRVNRTLTGAEYQYIDYSNAFNPTQGGPFTLADIRQSIKQQFNLGEVEFWNAMLGLAPVSDALRDFIADQLAKKIAEAGQIDSGKVQEHAKAYKKYISSGHRVVVVAHSQGNLHVHQAANLLTAEELPYFSIVAVATPDAMPIAKTMVDYTTLTVDLVAKLFTLPANTLGSPRLGDLSGHEFVASYLADGSTSEARIIDFTLATMRALPAPPIKTLMTLTTTPNPSLVGENVAMTANVQSSCAAPDGPKLAGAVTWSVDLTPLIGCGGAVNPDGQARCLISFATAGTHNVFAQFTDGETFAQSNGSTTQTTTPGPPIPTIVAVTATPNPAQVGALVTMNASVASASVAPAGPSPTGTVTWSADSTPLIGCSGTITPAGQASCAFSFSTVGAHNVAAEYSGDANFAPSIGSTTETIDGPFAFEVAESAVPLNPRLYCSHYEGEYQISGYYASFDRCRSDMSAVIRCVGSGCDSSRFAVSVSKSILGAGGGGACPSVQSDFGIDPVGSQTYVAGSYFWFPLGNDWTKAWPSISNISPVPNYQSAFVSFQWLNGDPGVCVPIGATLDLAFNVYDKRTGTYTVIPFFMSVP